MTDDLAVRVAALEERLDNLENKRKGGRPSKPILVKAEGVCGVDPESDSAVCPHASLYRRRQGCAGTACMQASSDYYKEHVQAFHGDDDE